MKGEKNQRTRSYWI